MSSPAWVGLRVKERRKIVRQVLLSRAPSTVQKYVREFRKYKVFLRGRGDSVSLPSSSLHISSYLSHLYTVKQSYSVLLQAFCALKWIHSLLPMDARGNPADTPLSRNIVEASKRSFSKAPNKKEPFTTEIITRICRMYGGSSSSIKELRIALIFSLGFSGLFRIGELLDLTAKDIVMYASYVEITVKKSKTDQYRQGNKVLVARTGGPACAHGLLSRYCTTAGIPPQSDQFIFRSLNSLKAVSLDPALNRPISYSTCREIIKNTLVHIGEDPKQFGTHSLRSGGATAMAHSNAENPDRARLLRLQGRWKSESTRDMYIKDSVESRLSLTKSLKL